MLRISKTRFYSVPVVDRTIDILELLAARDCPLKCKQIADSVGISRSTTYRILRTLLQRGYVSQDLDGRFAIAKHRMRIGLPIRVDEMDCSEKPSETQLSVEEIVHMLRAILERAGSLDKYCSRP